MLRIVPRLGWDVEATFTDWWIDIFFFSLFVLWLRMTLEAGTGWDQATNDDVFFETTQPVFLTFNSSFCEDSCGFLEGSSRDEGLGVE